MCGICGIAPRNQNGFVDGLILDHMNNTLTHRGPDDSGCFIDPLQRVGLAMRRLSIIDLATGHQPMTNEDKSVWIVFNGEIYNHLDIRKDLQNRGHIFSTQADTEAILHAYEEYGLECIHHLNGMFAFAIWDSRRNRLLLVRDRVGIKPLYYHLSPNLLIFASELKGLLAHPDTPRQIDPLALDQFLSLEYIPAPRTIFKDVHKLPPGHRLILEEGQVRIEPYWEVKFQPIEDDEATCAERLSELLYDAVKIRLMADVPLGAFLSGGIDSSTVVAFMSQAAHAPVRTFSIGFDDASYNELPFARLVSQQFGTQHQEVILQPDIQDLTARLVAQFDEPFADFSIFSTYLVCEVASQHVKVVLSGDGGDEVFAGYETYLAQSLDRRYYRHVPAWLRTSLLPRLLASLPPSPAKKGFINKAKRFVEGGALPAPLQHTRWMMFLQEADKQFLYTPDLRLALSAETPGDLLQSYFQRVSGIDSLAQGQYVDIKTYLAEDILTKVDRMSMAVSLEARVPLLDYRIVEFALNLPPRLKLTGGQTKIILRHLMADRLPKAILDKPKEGFSIPLKHWLGQELRPLMTDLLAQDTLQRRGYFSPECVNRWINEHMEQKANHSHRLWALMVFEMWHRHILETPPTHPQTACPSPEIHDRPQ
jgi:asparagine synthase (glutamine-hydrolysing)